MVNSFHDTVMTVWFCPSLHTCIIKQRNSQWVPFFGHILWNMALLLCYWAASLYFSAYHQHRIGVGPTRRTANWHGIITHAPNNNPPSSHTIIEPKNIEKAIQYWNTVCCLVCRHIGKTWLWIITFHCQKSYLQQWWRLCVSLLNTTLLYKKAEQIECRII